MPDSYEILESSTVTQSDNLVHGVALGAGDTTTGMSGKRTRWPPEVLEDAANLLEGVPIVKDHPGAKQTSDGLQVDSQPPIDAKVGEVTDAKFKDGVGLLWQGRITDDSIREKVADGLADVSPVLAREIQPVEGEEDVYEATSIQAIRDLGVVSRGASPSNSIDVGAAAALSEAFGVDALQDAGDINLTPPEAVQSHAQDVLDWREEYDVEGMTETGWNRAEQLADGGELSTDDIQEISAWFSRHGPEEYELNEEGMEPWEDNGRVAIKGWGGPAMRDWVMDKRSQLADAGVLEALSKHMEALREVAGVEFTDTATGELDESEIPNDDYESHYLYPGDTKTESSYPVVDADGTLRRGNVDAAWGLGARGDVDEDAHDQRLLELAAEFENPPEWADGEMEAMAAVEDVSEGTLVSWNSGGDRDAYGRVEEVRREGDDALDSEIDGDVTVEPPAALITVHQPGEDGWMETDTQVGHTLDSETLSVVEELPSPESLTATSGGVWSDDPAGASSPGCDNSQVSDTTMTSDNTESLSDGEQYLLRVAGDQPEASAEALEAYHNTDDPTIITEDEYDALTEQVNVAKDLYAESLADQWGTDKDKIKSNFGLEALREEFETEDGGLDREALVQQPQTSQPTEEDTEDAGLEALEDEQVEKAEALYADYEMMSNPPERLEDRIVEALEMTDFSEAMEVLD